MIDEEKKLLYVLQCVCSIYHNRWSSRSKNSGESKNVNEHLVV